MVSIAEENKTVSVVYRPAEIVLATPSFDPYIDRSLPLA